MDKGLTAPKWLPTNCSKITQMTQNLSAQIVCPSPNVWDLDEKRLHWASGVCDQTHGGNFQLMGHVISSIPYKDSIYVGENPNVYKSFGQKTRQNAAPVFSDALAFDPVTIDDLNHLEHFIFETIHILRKHILGFLDTLST